MQRRLISWLAAAALATACSSTTDEAVPAPAVEDTASTESKDTGETAEPDTGSTESDAGESAPDTTEDSGVPPRPSIVPVDKQQSLSSEPMYEPNALHLTWQRDVSTTMTVQWKTTGIEIEAHVPKVLINKKGDYFSNGEVMMWSEANVTTGFGKTWQTTLADGLPPIDDEVYAQYEVELTDLEPYTDYVYIAGFWDSFDPATGRFVNPTVAEVREFRTGRAKGTEGPVRFVMAGDSRGGTDEIAANIDRLAAIDVDMWFFNGDMTTGGTQPEWDTWFEAMLPLMSNRVLMPVQGNHEIFPSPYYEQYALPVGGPELPDHLKEHAWSIDYGNVHFIGLDSIAPALMEEQTAWLESDLAAAKADPAIDWIIAMHHHPAYSAGKHGSTGRVQDIFVPLYEKYDVDFVFSGHDHAYERSVPVRNGEQVEQGAGPVYVVAGGFYSPGYKNGTDWWTVVSHHGDIRNFVVMEIDGKTAKLVAYDGAGGPGTTPKGEELDEYTITKE